MGHDSPAWSVPKGREAAGIEALGRRERLRCGQSSWLAFLSLPNVSQESLRLQEQVAEAEDGEGLQQTLRDLAQVLVGTMTGRRGVSWEPQAGLAAHTLVALG